MVSKSPAAARTGAVSEKSSPRVLQFWASCWVVITNVYAIGWSISGIMSDGTASANGSEMAILSVEILGAALTMLGAIVYSCCSCFCCRGISTWFFWPLLIIGMLLQFICAVGISVRATISCSLPAPRTLDPLRGDPRRGRGPFFDMPFLDDYDKYYDYDFSAFEDWDDLLERLDTCRFVLPSFAAGAAMCLLAALAAARLMIRAVRARRAAASARAVEASALSAKRNTGDAADGKPADDRVSVGDTVFASNGIIVGYLLLSLLVCGWGLSVLTMLSSDSMQRVLSSAPPPSHPPFPPAPPEPPMTYRYLRPPPPSPSPPQPPSTPTPPGLPPTPLWPVGGSPFHVRSGPCRRVGACVTSSNFDVRSISDFPTYYYSYYYSYSSLQSVDGYRDYERCSIDVTPEVELSVLHFDTEEYSDRLVVTTPIGARRRSYSGTIGPDGVHATHLDWNSDGNSRRSGWAVCARGAEADLISEAESAVEDGAFYKRGPAYPWHVLTSAFAFPTVASAAAAIGVLAAFAAICQSLHGASISSDPAHPRVSRKFAIIGRLLAVISGLGHVAACIGLMTTIGQACGKNGGHAVTHCVHLYPLFSIGVSACLISAAMSTYLFCDLAPIAHTAARGDPVSRILFQGAHHRRLILTTPVLWTIDLFVSIIQIVITSRFSPWSSMPAAWIFSALGIVSPIFGFAGSFLVCNRRLLGPGHDDTRLIAIAMLGTHTLLVGVITVGDFVVSSSYNGGGTWTYIIGCLLHLVSFALGGALLSQVVTMPKHALGSHGDEAEAREGLMMVSDVDARVDRKLQHIVVDQDKKIMMLVGQQSKLLEMLSAQASPQHAHDSGAASSQQEAGTAQAP